jgi:hypothetical protein
MLYFNRNLGHCQHVPGTKLEFMNSISNSLYWTLTAGDTINYVPDSLTVRLIETPVTSTLRPLSFNELQALISVNALAAIPATSKSHNSRIYSS